MLQRLRKRTFGAKPAPELSELALAKQKLQRAQCMFDCANEASFEHANAELAAAITYMSYVSSKTRLSSRGGC